LKILFVIDTLGSGGKERRLSELIRALQPYQGIEFELVVMSNDIHYSEILNQGLNIHRIIRVTAKDPTVFRRLYILIRDYKPDIVHCWDSMTAVYTAPVCRLLRCRLVNGMVINCPEGQNIFNKHWLRARFTFPISDFIVGNSKAGLIAYRAPKNKSIVVYNGFDFSRTQNLTPLTSIRKELNITSNYTVGMVANFRNHKDYPTYFNAAQLLLDKGKDITFLAIGTDTDSSYCKNLIKKANLNHFRLIGKKTGVESYINAMDVCVLSTFTEGISNSILEYMALGKPVVATRGGGTVELVKENETGFLVDQHNPLELAVKIEILLENPVLQESMGKAGKEHIKSEFSIEQMVQSYLNLYLMLSSRS
jgi:glycosyltransferase involved in cell wall biosynthesis